MSLLRLSLKRHTESTVRATIHAQRVAEELRKALTGTEIQGEPPTSLLILCNGYFTTLAGEGSLYNQFKNHKNIVGCEYTGRNLRVRTADDEDYKKCRLRDMTFDRAFSHCMKNAQDHGYSFRLLFHSFWATRTFTYGNYLTPSHFIWGPGGWASLHYATTPPLQHTRQGQGAAMHAILMQSCYLQKGALA